MPVLVPMLGGPVPSNPCCSAAWQYTHEHHWELAQSAHVPIHLTEPF